MAGILPERPEDLELRLERLRTLYFLGVANEEHLDRADQEVASIRDLAGFQGRNLEPLVDAFAGAVEVVRGKHAFWPGNKVGHVRRGLVLLDRAVERAPTSVEILNLRLLSTFYLPFFFRRGDTTRADLTALATLLPRGADDLPTHVWMAISDFVLAHGTLTPADRDRLLESRQRVQDETAAGTGSQS